MSASDNRGRHLAEFENVVRQSAAATVATPGDEQIVWDGLNLGLTPTETPFPPTAGPTEVVSDSGDDALGGIGAERLQLWGVDASYQAIEDVVELDGLTPVPTEQFFRVYRAEVIDAGSSEKNLGNLSIQQTTGPLVIGYVLADYSRTLTSCYTVPDGKRLTIKLATFSGDAANTERAWGRVRKPNGVVSVIAEFNGRGGRPGGIDGDGGDAFPIPVEARTDVWMSAQAGADSRVSTYWLGELEEWNPPTA